MPLCSKTQKQVRPELKPREGPYKKTNSYTNSFSVEQVLTLFLALLVAILHSIFVVKPITVIDHPILYVLLALNYILVAGLLVTYVQITMFDPVDSYIAHPERVPPVRQDYTPRYCRLCRSYTHDKSYHCKRCNRCTQDFDHHCAFLNNCIGSLNYELFMRLLLLFITFLLNNIAQAVWAFVRARVNLDIRAAAITEWMLIAIIIICILELLATTVLLVFHCYISCCLDLTTIAFIQTETHSNMSNNQYQQNGYIGNASPGPHYPNNTAENMITANQL